MGRRIRPSWYSKSVSCPRLLSVTSTEAYLRLFFTPVDLEAAYRKSWRKYIALEQRLYSSLFATADVFCGTALGSGASKVMGVSRCCGWD